MVNVTSSESFWIAIGTMVCASIGLVTRYCYKSKCKEITVCCIHIKRDVEDEIAIDQQQRNSIDQSRSMTQM